MKSKNKNYEKIFLDNYFNLEPEVNLAHHKLMKGGKVNIGEIENTKKIIIKYIQIGSSPPDLKNSDDFFPGIIKDDKVNNLSLKADKRLSELKHELSKENEKIDLSAEKNENFKEMDDISKQNSKTILEYMHNPVSKFEKIMLKSYSSIIYTQLLTLILRCIVCINLVWSRDTKQMILNVWEIIAASPHLWTYINEYGFNSIGFIGKQLLKFPLFRILFEFICKLVKAPSDKSSDEIIDSMIVPLKGYFDYFLQKSSQVYQIYRYFYSEDSSINNLCNIISKMSSENLKALSSIGKGNVLSGTYNLIGNQTYLFPVVSHGVGVASKFFNMSLQPENLISWYGKAIKGDDLASKVVKNLSLNGGYAIGMICSVVCMNSLTQMGVSNYVGKSSVKTECSLCNILLKFPFVVQSIMNISVDLLHGIWSLKNHYGQEKKIGQKQIFSAICVVRLPFESNHDFIERQSKNRVNILVEGALNNKLKVENGKIEVLTASDELKNAQLSKQDLAESRQLLIDKIKQLDHIENKKELGEEDHVLMQVKEQLSKKDFNLDDADSLKKFLSHNISSQDQKETNLQKLGTKFSSFGSTLAHSLPSIPSYLKENRLTKYLDESFHTKHAQQEENIESNLKFKNNNDAEFKDFMANISKIQNITPKREDIKKYEEVLVDKITRTLNETQVKKGLPPLSKEHVEKFLKGSKSNPFDNKNDHSDQYNKEEMEFIDLSKSKFKTKIDNFTKDYRLFKIKESISKVNKKLNDNQGIETEEVTNYKSRNEKLMEQIKEFSKFLQQNKDTSSEISKEALNKLLANFEVKKIQQEQRKNDNQDTNIFPDFDDSEIDDFFKGLDLDGGSLNLSKKYSRLKDKKITNKISNLKNKDIILTKKKNSLNIKSKKKKSIKK